MAVVQDIEFFNTLGKIISTFERFHLEGSHPAEFDPVEILQREEQVFFRIEGLANFWERDAQFPQSARANLRSVHAGVPEDSTRSPTECVLHWAMPLLPVAIC